MDIQRPIKLTIAALGGQGGGVLADWLIEIAEAEGYLAQSTSVPGVAQRTGATIYYLEFFPVAAAERAGREPIMALMPVPGDVDCVVASELAEAGRAVQRGFVNPDRTTLIASSHRSYAIGEKSAMGQGAVDEAQLTELVRSQAKRLVLFDMDAVAERNQSVISSVLLGAICGAGVLPFRRETYESEIRKSGIAVKTNLAAFEDARQLAERGGAAAEGPEGQRRGQSGDGAEVSVGESQQGGGTQRAGQDATGQYRLVPVQARSRDMQPLLDRVRKFAAAVQGIVFEGVIRSIDYQDPAYASLYLDRLERIEGIDARFQQETANGALGAGGTSGGGGSVSANITNAQSGAWALTEATARGLALWMTFEDTIRVADLKTRSTRFERVRSEIRADADQLFGITEFMKPRVEEIAGTLPVGIGRWVLGSPGVSRWLKRWTGGKRIRTSTVTGFLFLHALGGMKRWRRGSLRYHEENARIESWLSRIEALAPNNYALAVELARAQRLIKGYGETHERGWHNFTLLVEQLDSLSARPDGATLLVRLQEAALADEEGKTLARELAEIARAAPSSPSSSAQRAVSAR